MCFEVLSLTTSQSRHSSQTDDSDSDSENETESESEEEPKETVGEGMEMQVLSKAQFSADPVQRDSAESLAFHDPTHVQLTLKVLGLMCDGQNRTLQVRMYAHT